MGKCLAVAVLLAAAAFVTVPSSTSRGQSVTDAFARALRDSDVVAAGTVRAATAFPYGPAARSGIHTSVLLNVDVWLRSDASASMPTVQFWAHGGTVGDRRRVVVGQPRFRLGERVVVLLMRDDAGALWPASSSFGKLPLADDGSIGLPQPGSVTSFDALRNVLWEP